MSSDRPMLVDRTVERADHGQRVDAVLAGWLGEPRGRVQRRLAEGAVLVDGAAVAKSHRLAAGERVVVQAADEQAAPERVAPVPVRFSDDHLLVVAKPAGLVVHGGAGVRSGTLVDALVQMGIPLAGGADDRRPGIVHRLDRGTSGLLVVAKTDVAAEGLREAFRGREVDRTYWALVDGVPDPPRATIDAPIGRSVRHRTRFVVDAAGRRAVSHYELQETLGSCSVVQVRLETGRTHQVRVHMAAVGHPVTGDTLYGASRQLAGGLGLDRPALHAGRLGFAHPVTGERVDLSEPLPAELQRAVTRLRERR